MRKARNRQPTIKYKKTTGKRQTQRVKISPIRLSKTQKINDKY